MSDIYAAKDIEVLEGLEAVRKRPAMYIGDTNKRGMHHLVLEIVDNAIDESLAGYCKNIKVKINKDNSITVSDDGRGIPVDIHPKLGKPALEVVATVLHAGGKFGKSAYKVSGGLHGVGLSVVNALSEWMEIEVHRNSKIYRQKYERGKPLGPVEVVGECSDTGTTVTFKPDYLIFSSVVWDPTFFSERFRDLAFLNSKITIEFVDELSDTSETFHYEGGLASFVEFHNRSKKALHPVIYASKEVSDVGIEFALQYTDGAFPGNLFSFVNYVKTVEGGTHVAGFRSALTRAINEYIKSNKLNKGPEKPNGEDVLRGLTAVISVKVLEPQFEGQTKTKLGNQEVTGAVQSAVYETLKRYLNENPSDARAIVNKVLSEMNIRLAKQKAGDLARRKTPFNSTLLPGKLADCNQSGEKSELFIVEGDSAGGSAKQGRDREFQAILPLRGKILNTEKASLNSLLDSQEIKAIISALGTGMGDDLDISKLRYGKIIIMTDADVDGSHIRALLLTLFYRYFRPLVERGYIYAAMPPLYAVKKGKKIRYALDEEELAQALEELGENATIQRYKGLGEMNPQQLWDTTMNPETRALKRITIEDAEEADRIIRILMAKDTKLRKEYIYQHAKEVENLDI